MTALVVRVVLGTEVGCVVARVVLEARVLVEGLAVVVETFEVVLVARVEAEEGRVEEETG